MPTATESLEISWENPAQAPAHPRYSLLFKPQNSNRGYRAEIHIVGDRSLVSYLNQIGFTSEEAIRVLITLHTRLKARVMPTGKRRSRRKQMTRSWMNLPWAEPYRLAMLESDPQKLTRRIQVAKTAISLRLNELNSFDQHESEIKALADALKVLRLLGEHAHLRKAA